MNTFETGRYAMEGRRTRTGENFEEGKKGGQEEQEKKRRSEEDDDDFSIQTKQ
jgi:hypothetical protein